MDEFFGSEFARFVNEATEASLLSLMFGLKWHATEANHRAIRRSELPKTLRRNECLARDQREEIDSELFYLPLWAEFIDDEQRDWGIKVKTPFGSVSVDWEISWANDAWYAEAYLAATGHLKGRDTHEIVAQVRLHYDCRFLRLHSQKLKEYVSWTGRLAEELRQLDWKSTETRLTFEILQALNAKLDAQRTRTPPAL